LPPTVPRIALAGLRTGGSFDDGAALELKNWVGTAERLRTCQVRQKLATCPQDFAICERLQGFFLDQAFPNSRHVSTLQLVLPLAR
jgi:hypothetical protein